jgi:anti-anti-sigma factor
VSASVFDRCAVGHFDATVARHGEILAVSVRGGLDFYSAQEARKLLLDLLEQEPSRLVIDTRFAFVDSSGIGVLVHVAQRARQERRDFRPVCQRPLAQVLRVHGLAEILGIEEPRATARTDQPEQQRRRAA